MLKSRSCGKPAECCEGALRAKSGETRRDFLAVGTAAISSVLLGDLFPGRVSAQDAATTVKITRYPRIRIAAVADLDASIPIAFNYPGDGLHTQCLLTKLNHKAGGGIGPKQDVVAFSARCTHMGGDLSEGFVSEHNVLGCAEHLTTFDLTRHGMVVAGHATQALPQIVLEVEGDDVYATGIIGLLYGYHSNPTE